MLKPDPQKPTVKPAEPESEYLPLPALLRMAGVVCFGPFLSQLDTTIINIALPTLSSELHAPLSTVQWVQSGYLLALALMIPLCGWFVDNLGAKRVYIAVFVMFASASTLCGLATSVEYLIAARVLQGMAGGLLAPLAQLMLARHAGPQMARMMAIISTPVMVAPIFGPSIAGAILHFGSWHWLFLLNLPLGILAISLAYFLLPPDAKPRRRRLDWIGFLLVSPGLVFLLDGMHRFAVDANDRTIAGGELFLAVSLLCAFVLRGWGRPDGLIDLKLFKRPTFNASAMTQFLAMANTHGGMMLFPLYLITARELSPSTAALIIAPMGMGVLATRPLVDRAIRRFGPRRVSVVGGLICLAATLPFAWPSLMLSPVTIAVLLFIRGFGVGFINMPSVISAYAGLPRAAVTHAATAINIFQRLGGPVATMTLALVLSAQTAAGAAPAASGLGYLSPAAFSVAFGVACLINILCILSATRLARKV